MNLFSYQMSQMITDEDNIKTLLNFFPVIAEGGEGKMVELDVRQVLTIPKSIKAREVVRRGFMSNLLFQNISGIFASTEAREILEQLNPVDVGKVTPRQTSSSIDTKDVQVDDNGDTLIPSSIVLAETEARFGEKVYADIIGSAQLATEQSAPNLASTVATYFTRNVLDTVKEIARDNTVTMAQAEQVVKQNANIIRILISGKYLFQELTVLVQLERYYRHPSSVTPSSVIIRRS